MDYKPFYAALFQPIEETVGALDPATSIGIIGFDCGGPLSVCTVGKDKKEFVTYVSCELAVVEGQKVGEAGPFEVMMNCNNEKWARDILTRLGRMSFEALFGAGDTIDIGPVVASDFPIQGVVVEEFARVAIERKNYGILRFIGVTRGELEFAMNSGSKVLIERLKLAGIYPRTDITRTKSVTPNQHS